MNVDTLIKVLALLPGTATVHFGSDEIEIERVEHCIVLGGTVDQVYLHAGFDLEGTEGPATAFLQALGYGGSSERDLSQPGAFKAVSGPFVYPETPNYPRPRGWDKV